MDQWFKVAWVFSAALRCSCVWEFFKWLLSGLLRDVDRSNQSLFYWGWDERQWQRCLRNRKGALHSPEEILLKQSNTEAGLLSTLRRASSVEATRRVSARLDRAARDSGWKPFLCSKEPLWEPPADLLHKPTWVYPGGWADRAFSFSNCYVQEALHSRPWPKPQQPLKSSVIGPILQLKMWDLEREGNLPRPHWGWGSQYWTKVPRDEDSCPQPPLWRNQKN